MHILPFNIYKTKDSQIFNSQSWAETILWIVIYIYRLYSMIFSANKSMQKKYCIKSWTPFLITTCLYLFVSLKWDYKFSMILVRKPSTFLNSCV